MKDVRKKLKSRIEKIAKHAKTSAHNSHRTERTHALPAMRKEARAMPKNEQPIGRFAFREEAQKISNSMPEIIVTGRPHWLADVQTRIKELESRGEFNLPEKDRWELSKLKGTLRKMNMSMEDVHEKAFE